MLRTLVLLAPGDQDTDPGVHSRGEGMMFSILLLWQLPLEVSLAVLLDGVVQVQVVEAWLVFQGKAGLLIKAQSGLDHQGSTI